MPKWEKGHSGNPGGKTKEQRKAEIAAAESAQKVQAAMLAALVEHVEADPVAALDAIKADPLKLIKDALDRGFGQPKAAVDVTNSDGSMSRTIDADKLTMDQRKAILAALVQDEPDTDES